MSLIDKPTPASSQAMWRADQTWCLDKDGKPVGYKDPSKVSLLVWQGGEIPLSKAKALGLVPAVYPGTRAVIEGAPEEVEPAIKEADPIVPKGAVPSNFSLMLFVDGTSPIDLASSITKAEFTAHDDGRQTFTCSLNEIPTLLAEGVGVACVNDGATIAEGVISELSINLDAGEVAFEIAAPIQVPPLQIKGVPAKVSEALAERGIRTLEALKAVPDEQLVSIEGVNAKILATIHKATA